MFSKGDKVIFDNDKVGNIYRTRGKMIVISYTDENNCLRYTIRSSSSVINLAEARDQKIKKINENGR